MDTFEKKKDFNIEKDSLKTYHEKIKKIKDKNERAKLLALSEGKTHYEGYKIPPYKKEMKIGRNDLCPCGSGKKFKICCDR